MFYSIRYLESIQCESRATYYIPDSCLGVATQRGVLSRDRRGKPSRMGGDLGLTDAHRLPFRLGFRV